MKINENIGEIAIILLSFIDQMKIFHWQTESYAIHNATDFLINKLTEHTDTFIETLQGSRNIRLKINNQSVKYTNYNYSTMIKIIKEYKKFLKDKLKLNKNETDLINIKDEMLESVNKTLYLLTLK